MKARRKQLSPGDPKTAVAYLRVSTDEQRLGPEAQRASIELWARHEGVRIESWHLDDGVSGGSPIDRRPALLEALQKLRGVGAGLLVVAKRDRLARDVAVALAIEAAARKEGARIASADGTGNGEGPSDDFMRVILDGAAAYERGLIRARTKAALAVKRSRGEVVGTVPYGFSAGKDGKLVENPKEQAVIKRVLELHAKGLSLRKIALALRPTVRGRTGQPLNKTQVLNILRKTMKRTVEGADLKPRRAIEAPSSETRLTATLGEHLGRSAGGPLATLGGGVGQGGPPGETSRGGTANEGATVTSESLDLQVEKSTVVEHPITGQRLVNRRIVKKADYLRHGAPLDLAWVRGQVATLAKMKISAGKIAAALVRTGVRRGDGSEVGEEDVRRWAS